MVGCGGAGDGGGGTTGGGPGGGTGGAFSVNLPASTDVQVLYLSGDNRRSPGSQYVELGLIRLLNSDTDFIPPTQSGSPIRLQLDGYSINSYNFAVTLPTGTPFKTYNMFPLRIDRVLEEDAAGDLTQVFLGPFETVPALDVDFTLFPGRQVSLAVYLNNGNTFVDGTGFNFDRTEFERENYDPIDMRMNSFLSDFVAFDISSMAASARPQMNNGAPAQKVFFSGDAIAMSAGVDTAGSFNMLFPATIDDGIIRNPIDLGGNRTPGAYTVVESDPRDPLGLGTITSLQGRWKDYTEVLNNTPDNALIVFPNSRRDLTMNAVLVRKAGGTVTALWQGVVRWDGVSTSAEVEVWSVDQIRSTDPAVNPAVGTVTVTVGTADQPSSGSYSFTTPPAGFPFATTGSFLVFAR